MLENILKSKWFLYLLGTAVVVVLVTTIIRLITPQDITVPDTAITTTNIDNSSSSFSNITFSGRQISVPNSFVIATAEENTVSLRETISLLQQAYNLELDADIPNLWRGTDYLLSLDSTTNTYKFGKSAPILEFETGFEEKGAVTSTATQIVQQFFPNTSLAVIDDDIQYQTGGAHLEETTSESAAVVSIPFSYAINDIPVYYQNRFQIPFELHLNTALEIQDLSFPNELLIINTVAQKNSISVNQALDNVNRFNKGAIIVSLFSGFQEISLENIVSGEFTDVSLEYRFDQETGLVLPFYRFKGTLFNQANTKIEAEVITPAVETSQL